VNAGDNTLSSFLIRSRGLTLRDKVPTGGGFPVSVATCGRYVYVLNAGNEGSITGYQASRGGRLREIRHSRLSVQAIDTSNPPNILVAPAQIAFTKDCSQLVVLNKDGAGLGLPDIPDSPGRFVVFPVNRHGRPSAPPIISDAEGYHFSLNLVETDDGDVVIHATDTSDNGSSVYSIDPYDHTVTQMQDTVSNGEQGPLLEFKQWKIFLHSHYRK
jgi:DNA-binding beta-propeller fold protein YncE